MDYLSSESTIICNWGSLRERADPLGARQHNHAGQRTHQHDNHRPIERPGTPVCSLRRKHGQMDFGAYFKPSSTRPMT
jgi:hypothetical protein